MSRAKRNRNLISYFEPEEPSFDDYIFCSSCGDYVYEYCSVHGRLLVIPDDEVPTGPGSGLVPRAALTIPSAFLHLAPSTIPGAGIGVFSTLALPAGLRFGPYCGLRTHAVNSAYCWQIFDRYRKPSHVLDARDENKSNWMRYVNCSRHYSEQNLVAFQYRGQLYYRTIKDIPRSTELLVFYGSEFASELHVDLRQYHAPFTQTLVKREVENCEDTKTRYEEKLVTETEDNKENVMHTGNHLKLVQTHDLKECENDVQRLEPLEGEIYPESNKSSESKRLKICHLMPREIQEHVNISVNINENISQNGNENISQNENENISLNENENISLNENENISLNGNENISWNENEKISRNENENISRNENENISRNENENISPNENENINQNENSVNEMENDNYSNSRQIFDETSTLNKTTPSNVKKLATNKVKTYACPICDAAFSTKWEFLNHDIKVHNSKKNYKACNICDYKTEWSGHLKAHMETHTTIKYKCDVCGYETPYSSYLERHSRTHKSTCKICKEMLDGPKKLRAHMKVHKNEKTICGNIFEDPSCVTNHMAVHNQDRPYKCEICRYGFVRKDHLIRHMKVHANKKPADVQTQTS